MDNRAPISHLAKAGATKIITWRGISSGLFAELKFYADESSTVYLSK